jgi:sec-independent protein translocase protein TatC
MTDRPDSDAKADDTDAGSSGMPFLDHLEELRWRLLKSILAVIVMAGAAFYFREQLFHFLIMPLGDTPLHFTEVTGSFYAYMKVAIITGLLAALPIVFYQLWAFIAPGLYRTEKAAVLPLVFISTLLFLVGAAFCYWMVLPLALQFLINFGDAILQPIITVGSYISFAGLMMVAFGAGFQLPIVAYFLGRLGILSSSIMARGRRYAIVIILIVGAIITPPDVITQVLLAGPIYLLYEISIIIVKLTGRREPSRKEEIAG